LSLPSIIYVTSKRVPTYKSPVMVVEGEGELQGGGNVWYSTGTVLLEEARRRIIKAVCGSRLKMGGGEQGEMDVL